jgi:hypothetical protein
MKKMTTVLLVLFILVAGSGYALAWAPQLQGKPYQYKPGESRGVFIWRDRDGLHLRTTTRGQEHVFSGVIRTDGRFADVCGVRMEGNDFIRLSRDRDTITFRFRTAGGEDGIDFRVWESERLSFDLFIDGHRIDTRNIYVGYRGWHPYRNEFTLR